MRFTKNTYVAVALLGIIGTAGCASKKDESLARMEAAAGRAESAANKAESAAKSAAAAADRAAAAADRAEAVFRKTTHK